MTVLRSREFVATEKTPPLTNPQTEQKSSFSKANNTPEPATPIKSHEPMVFHSQSKPSSPSHSSYLSPADSGFGSGSVTELTFTPVTTMSETVTPRRSSRLALKSDGVGVEFTREVPVSGKQRKRKIVSGGEDSDAVNDDTGFGLVGNQVGDGEGEQGVEKAELFLVEEANVDLGVVGTSSGVVHKVFETSSNEGELGPKVEKSVSNLGKRKLSTDGGLYDSDGVVGFLNLRSGKKISKMLMVSEKKVDQRGHWKQDENGGDEEDKGLGNEVPLIAKAKECNAGRGRR